MNNQIIKKVKNHNEFLLEINKFSNKYILLSNVNFNDDESPYSKEYVDNGKEIEIIFYKYEKDKKSFYWKWR